MIQELCHIVAILKIVKLLKNPTINRFPNPGTHRLTQAVYPLYPNPDKQDYSVLPTEFQLLFDKAPVRLTALWWVIMIHNQN